MTIHAQPHPCAGETVTLPGKVTDPVRNMVTGGAEFRVEDWWDRVTGKSWTATPTNMAVYQYGMRIFELGTIPTDDEVLYGKIGAFDHLVHASELPDRESQ